MYIFNGACSIWYNAPQNINEYHYIWGSDLRECGLKGFGLVRVYCFAFCFLVLHFVVLSIDCVVCFARRFSSHE